MNAIVLFGGKSFEHDISIITAVLTIKNSKDCSFNLLPVYVSKNEEWFFYLKDNLEVKLFHDFDKSYKKNGFVRAHICLGENYLCYRSGLGEKRIKIDACLNCCHGGAGEDGSLAASLFSSGIAVSSFSLAGMSICMDKALSKQYFKALKAPVVDSFELSRADFKEGKAAGLLEKLKFPVIIKPCHLGSSIGISVAKDYAEFEKSAEVAFEFDGRVLVEKALDGFNEYNVACMRTKNGEVLTSQVDKPTHTSQILSFEDKYIGSPSGATKKGKGAAYLKKKKFAEIDKELEQKLQALSREIYEGLDMLGPVRIDFLEHKKKVYVNEVNAVPGSLAYYFFVPSVYKTWGKYVDELLFSAIEYKKNRAPIKKEFITTLI